MQIYIQERMQTGTTARISATNVFNVMNQQATRTQLQSQLLVENLFPKTGMSKDVLKSYLDNPPAGTVDNAKIEPWFFGHLLNIFCIIQTLWKDYKLLGNIASFIKTPWLNKKYVSHVVQIVKVVL